MCEEFLKTDGVRAFSAQTERLGLCDGLHIREYRQISLLAIAVVLPLRHPFDGKGGMVHAARIGEEEGGILLGVQLEAHRLAHQYLVGLCIRNEQSGLPLLLLLASVADAGRQYGVVAATHEAREQHLGHKFLLCHHRRIQQSHHHVGCVGCSEQVP